MNSEQLKKITEFFILEAKEHLEVIGDSLDRLQSTVDDPELLQEVYRGAHSIKGGAAMLELESIRTTAHRLEDYFKFLQETPLQVDQQLETLLKQVYQALRGLVDKLEETFNIPENFAAQIMAKVEPIFARVKNHLDQLAQGKAPPPSAASLEKIAHLQEEIAPHLREIIKLREQGDEPGNRVRVQTHCQQLAQIGREWNIPTWVNLLQTAQAAIAYPGNDYKITLKLIQENLEKALKHIQERRLSAIAPSPDLQGFAAPPPIEDPYATAVGAAELNTLANLFEGEGFESHWQEEVLDPQELKLEGLNYPEDNWSMEAVDEFNDLLDTNLTSSTDLDGLILSPSDNEDDPFGTIPLTSETPLPPGGEFSSLAHLFGEEFSFDSTEKDKDKDIFGSIETPLREKLSHPTQPMSGLDTFFGNDSFEEELSETPLKKSRDEWLDITPERQATKSNDSLDSLFGEGFSFEEDEANSGQNNSSELLDNLAESNHFAIGAPPASEIGEDLDRDLDFLFSEMDERESQMLSEQTIELAKTVLSPLEPKEHSTLSNNSTTTTDDFTDLLQIGDGSTEKPGHSTLTLFGETIIPNLSTSETEEDFDPLATLFQDLPIPVTLPETELSESLDFNGFSDDAAAYDDLDDLDDLEAYLSGVPEDDDTTPQGLAANDFDDLEAYLSGSSEDDDTTPQTLENLQLIDLEIPEEESATPSPELNNFFDAIETDNSLDFLDLEGSEEETATPFLDNLEIPEEESATPSPELDNFLDAVETEENSLDFLDLEIPEEEIATPSPELNNFLDAVETENSLDFLDLEVSEEEIATPSPELNNFLDAVETENSLDFLDLEIPEEEIATPSPELNNFLDAVETENSLDFLDLEVSENITSEAEEQESLLQLNELETWLETENTNPAITSVSGEGVALAALFEEAPQKIAAEAQPKAEPILEVEEELATLETDNWFEIESKEVIASPPLPERFIPYELDYYERLEDLESLLEQPIESAKDLQIATTFAELETLLESQTIKPVITTLPDLVEKEVKPDTSTSPEEDFGDVEKLLDEVIRGGEIVKGSGRSPATRGRSSNKAKAEQTLKVPVKQMDNLSNLMGELVVNRNSLEGDEERLRLVLDNLMHQVQTLSDVGGRMQDLYERSLLENALLRSRREYRSQQAGDLAAGANVDHDYDSLEMDSFTKFHELAQETIEMIVRVRESASDIQILVDDIDQVARSLRQVTSQLQEGLTKTRMVPFGTTASRLPLAVKKIAPELGKQVNLRLDGQETLIDKMILEHLSSPLTHLVNNSITHGIETPEVRRQAGKSPVGQVVVSALQQGNQTVISVSDDGAGIDLERVRMKAVEKGLKTKYEASRLTTQEVYDLLFHPGFSTQDRADNYSGRGVGLDVVRTDMNEIRGTVTIDSKPGKGTTFTIRLPLTLSICKALCCISENSPLAFPLDGVEDMLEVPQHKLQRNKIGHLELMWKDMVLPYCHLSELLTYNRRIGRINLYSPARDENVVSVIILHSGDSYIAVGVDRVLGEQEIVIKQLQGPVLKPPGIAGATVQGDGYIMAIADVLELIEISEGHLQKYLGGTVWQDSNQGMEGETILPPAEPMVLIVDDSITVRELLSMTFSKAGYRVEQARDGQDAWDKLKGGLPCDIVFCDIEMPKVDGLDLLGRMQKDEKLSELPIAMLTSRGAERHRKVAAELGACGYFTKPYLEEILLDAAQRMIDGEVLLEGSTRKPKPPKQVTRREEPITLSAIPTSEQRETQPRVLIIDDSVTVRSLLSITFEKAGYEVEQARDGQDALNKLKNGLRPHLAICDIEMPRMDGLEFLQKVSTDKTLQNIPIAMLTSRGSDRHRNIAAERGASGYFTKPYVEQELLAAAERIRKGEVLLANSSRLAATSEPETPPSPPTQEVKEVVPTPKPLTIESFADSIDSHQTYIQPSRSARESKFVRNSQQNWSGQPKVLIIDDSVTVRSLLSITFEKAGYIVEQAKDGQDALNKLKGGLKPDIAFCDIEMPRMDGLKLLQELQNDEILAQIPIAMLTSRGAKKHRQIAAERGAKGYFTKPYVEDVLLDAARRITAGEVLLEVEI